MGKLTPIDGKSTSWEGLWWHPENCAFSSAAIDLSDLRKFKGKVRLYVKKNKFYNRGENGRPNYIFCLRDARSDTFSAMVVREGEDGGRPAAHIDDDGHWHTDDGERLYTRSEVQHAVNCAAEDGAGGYGWGENLVSDYL